MKLVTSKSYFLYESGKLFLSSFYVKPPKWPLVRESSYLGFLTQELQHPVVTTCFLLYKYAINLRSQKRLSSHNNDEFS